MYEVGVIFPPWQMSAHPDASHSEDDSVNHREQIKVIVLTSLCVLSLHLHNNTSPLPPPHTHTHTHTRNSSTLCDRSKNSTREN